MLRMDTLSCSRSRVGMEKGRKNTFERLGLVVLTALLINVLQFVFNIKIRL